MVSVELLHIYGDEQIGEEHTSDISRYLEMCLVLPESHSVVVLIDDYNTPLNPRLPELAISLLVSHGVGVAHVAMESALVPNAEHLVSTLTSRRLRESHVKYREHKGVWPCSLLTAAWYLTRLGRLPASGIFLPVDHQVWSPAAKVVNILPEGYRAVEKRAAQIMRASALWSDDLLVENHFHEGRTARTQSLS